MKLSYNGWRFCIMMWLQWKWWCRLMVDDMVVLYFIYRPKINLLVLLISFDQLMMCNLCIFFNKGIYFNCFKLLICSRYLILSVTFVLPRERSYQFIVQAYLCGPENVNLQETGPFWNKFQQALCYYEDPKK